MSAIDHLAPARTIAHKGARHGTTLIVPGYRGSGPDHWQTWIESRIPGARRVCGIDWETPALGAWAAAVRAEISRSPEPLWIVAHSFGCLASVLAATDRAERVAGALLVAPADPQRFSPAGLRAAPGSPGRARVSLLPYIPKAPLGFPCLVVASRNDPWMPLPRVKRWARLWDAGLVDLGNAGHINVESGFGPWPQGLALLCALQAPQDSRTRTAARQGVAAGCTRPFSA